MPEFGGLHYELRGEGPLLVVQPGGPGSPATYLAELSVPGRTLLMLDPRGTGGSAAAPVGSFSVLADDLEALRIHLGVDQFDLLGHSAGAWVPMQYAARHPERVSHLVLLTPSRIPIPMQPGELERPELAEQYFGGLPWFPAAFAAFTAEDSDPVDLQPIIYGDDTPAVREHASRDDGQVIAARNVFWADDFDPARLSELAAPVTIIAGDRDIVTGPYAPEILAGMFPKATVTVLAGSGHMSFITHPQETAAAIEAAL